MRVKDVIRSAIHLVFEVLLFGSSFGSSSIFRGRASVMIESFIRESELLMAFISILKNLINELDSFEFVIK